MLSDIISWVTKVLFIEETSLLPFPKNKEDEREGERERERESILGE